MKTEINFWGSGNYVTGRVLTWVEPENCVMRCDV